jgi:hypothetical protein
MRRRFQDARRRRPITPWRFLRPPDSPDEARAWRDHVHSSPHLLREVRSSLAIQMGVLGTLAVSCAVLAYQVFGLMRTWRGSAAMPHLRWMVPAIAVFLGWLAVRRFLRVLAEFRSLQKNGNDSHS